MDTSKIALDTLFASIAKEHLRIDALEAAYKAGKGELK